MKATSTDTATATPTLTPTPTPPPGFLFADGFEAGNLSAWSSAQTDHGDLRASRRSAIEGSFGLEAVIDDNRAIYVVDESPAGETAYRARFAFDPNATSIGGGRAGAVFLARGSDGRLAFRIEVRAYQRNYQVRAVAPQDEGTAYGSPWSRLSDGPHFLEIDWWSAAGPGARDGGLELWVDGQLTGAQDRLGNYGRQVDSIRLGAVNGADAKTRGMYIFDSFASTDGWPIGP